MTVSAPIHAYRIAWAENETERCAVATVDADTARIQLRLPDDEPVSLDVVTARAVIMMLSDAVYRALEPTGPTLVLEADIGAGFTDLRELT